MEFVLYIQKEVKWNCSDAENGVDKDGKQGWT